VDLILLLKWGVMGLVEGLTEFLPISSTGHLILVGSLLGLSDAKAKVFDIAIQTGAIFAVILVYWQKIKSTVLALPTQRSARLFALNVLVGFLPAVVLGLLPLATALAQKCPDVQFVLDHCGGPDVQGRVFDPWRDQLAELARLPNVACKISGIVAAAGTGWTVADLQPWVEHVVANFGWERVLWGGDWPVCTLTATLQQWVEAADQLFAAATDIQREKVFSRNAERIYRV